MLAQGAAALSDAELLALILNTGYRGCSALQVSARLLSDAGSLRQLLSVDSQQICVSKGVGPAKYARLMASVELGRRYLGQFPRRGMKMKDASAVRELLSSRLRDRERESFVVLFLDNRHRLLHYEEMFHGTIDSASVYPREIVRRAIAHNAAALIIAHNHPSGVAEPSAADQRITEKIQTALKLMEIRLLDHFIVGDTEVVSFTEKGLL